MMWEVAEIGTAMAKIGGAAAFALSGLGSALGTGAAGSGAIGAWKKCFIQKKPAPFQLLVFAGAPLSQTIYGMILMFFIMGKAGDATAAQGFSLMWSGVVAGMGIGVSAWLQGKAAAGACDSFAETGKGFTNDLMVLGIVETTALFIMALLISVL